MKLKLRKNGGSLYFKATAMANVMGLKEGDELEVELIKKNEVVLKKKVDK